MTRQASSLFAGKLFACVALFTLASVVPASAQTESDILDFQCNTTTGAYPLGALASGGDGTLYGTTSVGVDCGTVFKLTPQLPKGKPGNTTSSIRSHASRMELLQPAVFTREGR